MSLWDGETNEFSEQMNKAVENRINRLFTALPGVIKSFDASRGCATATPAVRVLNGEGRPETVPDIPCMPVIFPAGGASSSGAGQSLTYRINPGDPCVIFVFSSSAAQWLSGGPIDAPPESGRRQDLSDGFVLVGLRQFTKPLQSLADEIDLHLGDDDGTRYVRLIKDEGVVIEAPADKKIKAGAAATDPVTLASLVHAELVKIGTATGGAYVPPLTPDLIGASKLVAE
jgi:hypothetical protein